MQRRLLSRQFWRDESGAVAAVYALALVPLVAMTGLAFDYTRLAGMDTELQNAADQAALAGATQLDRSPTAIARATAAIQGDLISNSTLFANDGEGTNVGSSYTDKGARIVFYATRAHAEADDPANAVTNSTLASYVSVTVEERAANYALTPIVGAMFGQLNATAVAGLGSALCRIPPLMMCNPDEDTSENPDFNANARKGVGLLAKPGGGSQWSPGNYGYLDLGANGATGVRQALGWDGPPGECLSQEAVDPNEPATVDTQTGNIASGPQAINTRFDVYSSQGCVSGGTCSPAMNVRKDLVRPDVTASTGNSCDIHSSGWQEPANPYHPTEGNVPFTGPLDAMGHPRDMCHAVQDGAAANCRTSAFGDGAWDRNAYFRAEYLRTAGAKAGIPWSDADWRVNLKAGPSPSPVTDINNITRYDVYLWEIANAGKTVDGVVVLGPRPASTNLSHGKALCAAAQGFTEAAAPVDRRRMSVAVVNCNKHNVSGSSTDVPVRKWVDVFLVQPSYDRGSGGKYTKKDEIYVEVIGETDISRSGAPIGPTIRRDVPYLIR